MGTKLNAAIVGTADTTYDLDKIAKENRADSEEALVVQIYNYGPGESPNPANPKLGQIWLSRMKNGEEIAATVKSVAIVGESSPIVTVGESLQYEAQVTPSTASQSVVWSSSDPTIAAIDDSGKVTFLKSGSTMLSAVSDVNEKIGAKLSITAIVKSKPEYLNIGGNTSEVVIGVGKSAVRAFSASILPSDAVQEVVWSSLGSEMASVVGGKATFAPSAASEGTAVVIKAAAKADPSVSASVKVIVKAYPIPTSITVAGASSFILGKSSPSSPYTATIAGADQSHIVWSTSDASVASIIGNGDSASATFLKAGEVTIIASSEFDDAVCGTIAVKVTEME